MKNNRVPGGQGVGQQGPRVLRGRPVGSRGRPIGSRGCPQDPRRSRGHFHHTLIPSPFDDQGSGMKATTNLSKLHLLGSEASLQSPPTWNLINNNNKRILFMISSFFNQLYNSPYGRSPKPFFFGRCPKGYVGG